MLPSLVCPYKGLPIRQTRELRAAVFAVRQRVKPNALHDVGPSRANKASNQIQKKNTHLTSLNQTSDTRPNQHTHTHPSPTPVSPPNKGASCAQNGAKTSCELNHTKSECPQINGPSKSDHRPSLVLIVARSPPLMNACANTAQKYIHTMASGAFRLAGHRKPHTFHHFRIVLSSSASTTTHAMSIYIYLDSLVSLTQFFGRRASPVCIYIDRSPLITPYKPKINGWNYAPTKCALRHI